MRIKWRRLLSLLMSLFLVFSLAQAMAGAEEEPDTAEIPVEGYYVSVTASALTAQPGDTITLDIQVYSDGEKVTDLAAADLSLTTWLDTWNDHTDGNGDADISAPNNLSTEVLLPSEGTYYLVTELYDSSWNVLASATTTVTVAEAPVEPEDPETPVTPEDPETPTTPENPSTPGSGTSTGSDTGSGTQDSPKTGDTAPLVILLALLAVSGGALVTLEYTVRK